jgi:Uma2 family endonuclease
MRMSEAEFVEWSSDENRGEWVDGEVVLMNAVEADHSELAAFLTHLLRAFVDVFDLGKMFNEPYQVKLPKQRRRRLPDLFFVSTERLNVVERLQCNGPPDLVVEIVSPESQSRDRRDKFFEYERAGVREYWLVDRSSRSFEAYSMEKSGKFSRILPVDGIVYSSVLQGFFFREEWVWQIKFPKVAPLTRAMSARRRKRSSTRKAR